MKFSKTYLQTMTDPSFPQEWREKGLEYKELKKLINGVVAELEGLGLSADVLRELLEPPEQVAANAGANDTATAGPRQTEPISTSNGKSSTETEAPSSSSRPSSAGSSADRRARSESRSSQGSEADSDSASDAVNGSLVAGLARLSTGRQASSAFIDPLSPLMEEEEARRRSVEKSMNVPPLKNDMPAPLMGQVMSANTAGGSSSAAGEWLAHVSHHNGSHRKRRGSSKRTPSSGGFSASGESNGESSREASAQPEPSSSLLAPQGDNTEFLRASPMTMLGIRQSRDESQERESSAEAEGGRATSPSSQWRLGRKDLQQLRRNSHSNLQRPAPPSPNSLKRRASSGLSSKQEIVASNIDDDQPHDWDGHAWRERQSLGWDSPRGSKKRTPATNQSAAQAKPVRWVQGKDGRRARAEYELGGTPHHPIPKIKLIIESPINSDDEAGDLDEDDDDDGRIVELPPSQPGSRRPSADLSAQDEQPNDTGNSGSHAPRLMRTREIVIPLTADTEFLDTLTASLGKLSELQQSQRDTFVTSTEDLCASVARAASPYASKNDLYVWREIFQLWVDMQIFESQREKDRGELSVDESEARLKRFAAELAKRGWLAENVDPTSLSPGGTKLARSKTAMQGALTLPMKDFRSTSAVEDFLRLNLALLDVKKFQRVNVEAARKILKKHDKRTALTASTGLRSFVQQQEYARMSGMGASAAAAMMSSMGMGMPAESTGTLVAPAHGTHPSLAALLPSSTTGLLSESLPHILLSLLTTTLLPILPSVDDYSCAICTGLAWRPIRLDCSHLFCIRCLVKLQKQGKKDCPLCRAPDVVKTADGRNMDPATVNMLKMWFPHEVDEKEHENDSDRKKEELAELGLEQKKCVIM